MDKLDLKDRKILYELDLNARRTDKEIAKKVGLSRESTRYRIQKLIDEGYINYFMTILNSMKLGYDWYRTFFKFQNITLEKEKEIIDWLKERASWITKVEGKWDLNTGIFCKNIYEFKDIINQFLVEFSSYINRYEFSIVTRMWHYHRDYLIENKNKTLPGEVMGFSSSKEYIIKEIDSIDYKILEILLKNARMKTIEIARKINSTEMVVRYRIKNLIKDGIILGFRPFLNIKKLGYIYFKLHITLQNLSNQKKEKILDYIHNHPKTIYTTELIGGADIETEFQVKNNEEFYSFIDELRKIFKDTIKDYEFMQYTNEYKFIYLPEMKFKD